MSVKNQTRGVVTTIGMVWSLSCAHRPPVASTATTPEAHLAEASSAETGPALKSVYPPVMLPPTHHSQKRISGDEPHLPAGFVLPDSGYEERVKICVDVTGSVATITTMNSGNIDVNRVVSDAVKGWKFNPLKAHGQPVPFCYFARFIFKIGTPL